MRNYISKLLALSLLITAGLAQAASTALLINDDSVMLHHISDPNVMLLHTTYQEYTLMYSQEPDPRNLMATGSFESENYAWKPKKDHSVTPRATLIAMDFLDRNLIALAGGAVYRYTPEKKKYNGVTEFYASIKPTTFAQGHFVWGIRAQANYQFDERLSVNFGYRNINVETAGYFYDGFERGLYFGMTQTY